jgi:hypothetical protein
VPYIKIPWRSEFTPKDYCKKQRTLSSQ